MERLALQSGSWRSARWMPALVLAGLLVGCGGGPAASSEVPSSGPAVTPVPAVIEPGASPVPRTLTPADDGRTYAMQVGQTADVVVHDPYAPDPVVDVDSTQAVNVSGSCAPSPRAARSST